MKKNIFIVEDDLKNLKLFKAILGKMPEFDVRFEIQGKQAFEYIKDEYPDLIILDIQLPEMSGIEICQELRKIEKFKKTPIIAVTALAMKGDKDRIMAAGFTDYISKPIKIKVFRETILKWAFRESNSSKIGREEYSNLKAR